MGLGGNLGQGSYSQDRIGGGAKRRSDKADKGLRGCRARGKAGSAWLNGKGAWKVRAGTERQRERMGKQEIGRMQMDGFLCGWMDG